MEKSKIIEIKEEVQVPGTDIILEKGDRVTLSEGRDYRDLFGRHTYRKGSWEDAMAYGQRPENFIPTPSQNENAAMEYMSAINDIIETTGAVFDLTGYSTFDDIPEVFGGSAYEFIVSVEVDDIDPEFFYVNTEGHDYARYVAWIPHEIAERQNLDDEIIYDLTDR